MSRNLKTVLWSGAVLLAVLGLIVLFLTVFDWNRAKPWINSRVSEATGRTFAIHGDLSLDWHRAPAGNAGPRGIIPWPLFTAQDVHMGNPEWADASTTMAEIGRVVFSVNPLALLGKKIVIPTLILDQPYLTLRRAADGKNNWTFQSGEPSAWQFELGRLALTEGRVRVIDAIKNADINITIDSLEEKQHDGYRIAWQVSGKFDKAPVRGSGKSGPLLSLREQDRPYPIDAQLRIGKTEIDVKGTVTQPSDLSTVDVHLKLSGASMAHLYPITGIVLPETPAFSTEGHLLGSVSGNTYEWRYQDFSGTVGESDISGTFTYVSRQSRPYLSGSLESKLLRFEDLGPLIGADTDDSRADKENNQPADKALPVRPFATERWSKIDADIKFRGKRIVRSKKLPIDNLVTELRLKEGVLSLAPLNFGIAGGNLTSTITLDGRDKAIKAKMQMAARRLKLRELFPAVESMKASLGELNGEIALSGTGNSVAELLATSNGEIKAVVDQGTVSKLLLEQIGLNVGSIVLTQLFGDKQVQLNCLASDFNVTGGLMEVKIFVVDTAEANLVIQGNINFAKEQLNLRINPETKEIRLFSLRSPIFVQGSFKKPDVNVDKRTLAAKAGGAVALGILAPVATAILPLINIGERQDSGCNALLEQLKQKPATAPSLSGAARSKK